MFKVLLLCLISISFMFSDDLSKENKESSNDIKIEEKKDVESFKLPSQIVNEEINSFSSNIANCPNYTKGFVLDKTKTIKEKNYEVNTIENKELLEK